MLRTEIAFESQMMKQFEKKISSIFLLPLFLRKIVKPDAMSFPENPTKLNKIGPLGSPTFDEKFSVYSFHKK